MKARTVLSVCAVVAALGMTTCHRGESTETQATESALGSLALHLTLSSGAVIDSVRLEINGPELQVPMIREIDISNEGATASALVGGLPAGHYFVELSGTSQDGETSCAGAAELSVFSGGQSLVTVPLSCTSEAKRGTAIINGPVNVCPELTFFFAGPLQTLVGGQIQFEAEAVDPDGDTVQYSWTATEGDLPTAQEATTHYNCDVPLTQVVELTFSDGTSACEQTQSVEVTCLPFDGECGDGVVDPGEECDPPDATVCDALCQEIPIVCGDGILQPGEECDPPNGVTCDQSCSTIVEGCGDGIVQPGEDCDPPDGVSCDDDCMDIVPVNECPVIEFFQVAPQQVFVGEMIDGEVSALDGDGGTLSYLWSSSEGAWDDVRSTMPEYTCTVPGEFVLRVDVSDGQGCTVADYASIHCLPPQECGNGIIEPGEECEPPGTPTCDSTCQAQLDCQGCCDVNCAWEANNVERRCSGKRENACNAYEACMVASGCAQEDVRECYCGSVPFDKCFKAFPKPSERPNGPCVEEIVHLTLTANPAAIGNRFTRPVHPLGAKNLKAMCILDACGAECL